MALINEDYTEREAILQDVVDLFNAKDAAKAASKAAAAQQKRILGSGRWKLWKVWIKLLTYFNNGYVYMLLLHAS